LKNETFLIKIHLTKPSKYLNPMTNRAVVIASYPKPAVVSGSGALQSQEVSFQNCIAKLVDFTQIWTKG
jgi:hypothetical protein